MDVDGNFNSLRQRVGGGGRGDAPSPAQDSDKQVLARRRSSKIDQTCTKFIMVISVIFGAGSIAMTMFPECLVSLMITKFMDSLFIQLGVSATVYAIVLDAGSTGSRVLAFTFYENPITKHLELVDELWEEVKPGLSSFADDPAAGAQSIQSLIEASLTLVPIEMRSKTPVSLKATAGLRLLPADKAAALISAVNTTLQNSGFNNKGVEIMSELHEGLYGWVTVNYLMEQLNNPRKSYVALDLGGGSTQITFSPKYDETFQTTPSNFLHQVSVIRQRMTIYSHSYLGLGLMAARDTIFKLRTNNSTVLSTSCVSNDLTWKYNSGEALVQPHNPSYETCMIQVMEMLDRLRVHQCDEVPTRKIAAFSYFYDRAVDAGILKKGESAVVQVQDFLNAAEAACSSSSAESFLCVDLVYISGLLHHGYKLSADAKLGLYKQINGYSTSWALGAAFALLEDN